MYIPPLKATQTQQPDTGKLRLYVISALRSQPIEDATVTVSYTGDPDSIIETAKTDSSGQIPELTLPAPPLEYSMAPSEYQPYSEYTFRISKEGFEDLDISGSEILPEATSIQRAVMNRPSLKIILKTLSFLLTPSMETIRKKFLKMKSNPWIPPVKSY